MSADRVVDDVKRIFDDLGDVAERLQAGRFAASMQPMAEGEASDPVVEATRRERERVVGEASRAHQARRAARTTSRRRAWARGDRPGSRVGRRS